MRKLLLLLIPLLVAGLLFLGYRFIVSSQVSATALQVTATPQAEVFLDNTSLGKTPLCQTNARNNDCQYNDTIKPGEHTVRLVPQGGAGLFNFEEKVILRSGVLTVLDRIFKSTEAESESTIISLEPIGSGDSAEIAVVSSPLGCEVRLDEQPQGVTPLLLKDVTASDHQIRITKEGYNSKTLRVRPSLGYRLTITSKLAILRMTQTRQEETAQESKEASPSATVRINDTPTGFLRVRESASTASRELARVLPNDSFPLLETKEGWYKIVLPDGKEGWISSQYAAKE